MPRLPRRLSLPGLNDDMAAAATTMTIITVTTRSLEAAEHLLSHPASISGSFEALVSRGTVIFPSTASALEAMSECEPGATRLGT